MYPDALHEIVVFFEPLPEGERRDNLLVYADQAAVWAPGPDERFEVEDVRRDEGCTDTVGVFLRVDAVTRTAQFRVSLGPEVQTLTKALATILCRGLDGATPEAILRLSPDFVPKIVGAELVRQRSRTVYYVLGRMQEAVAAWRGRDRMA